MRTKEELEGELSQKASIIALWRSLIEHPGWELFKGAMTEQRGARLLVLAEPSTGLGTILQQEFMKGEGSGLHLAMNFPELQVELLKSEVKRLATLIEMEESHVAEKERADVSRGRVDSPDWWGGESTSTKSSA